RSCGCGRAGVHRRARAATKDERRRRERVRWVQHDVDGDPFGARSRQPSDHAVRWIGGVLGRSEDRDEDPAMVTLVKRGAVMMSGACGTSVGAWQADVSVVWAANHEPRCIELHDAN